MAGNATAIAWRVRWLALSLFAAGYILLSNLLYLPGPDAMYEVSNLLHSLLGLGFLLVILLPAGVIWLTIGTVKKITVGWWPVVFIFLGVVPLADTLFLRQLFLDASRNRTITEAAPLIDAVNDFFDDKGSYPSEVVHLVPDYLPAVPTPTSMGMREYVYRTVDSTYEIEFHQNVILSFNFEVVIYNPLGTQIGRGEMPALQDAGAHNWKYFLFD